MPTWLNERALIRNSIYDRSVGLDVVRDAQRLRHDRQPGLTAADEGKNDASTTNRFSTSWVAAPRIEHRRRAGRCRSTACRTGASCSCSCASASSPSRSPGRCSMRVVSLTSCACAVEVVRAVVQPDAAVRLRPSRGCPRAADPPTSPASRRRATPRLVRPQRNPRHDGLRHDAVRPALRLDLAERVRSCPGRGSRNR